MNHSSSIGTAPPAADIEAFVTRWRGSTASELSTAQSFTIELCELLGVPRPHATAEQDYMFERPLTLMHGDGTSSARRIDCYRRGCFVLESKKLDPGAQAATTGRTHRIRLDDLHRPEIRERLRALWLDPMSLDPSRVSARVTRAVSAELAELARSLEQAGHPAEQVAAFLTRCLFSMFAEDVGLLPRDDDGRGAFVGLLTRWRDEPPRLGKMLQALWATMDSGGFSPVLAQDLMRFNGKLFKGAGQPGYVLPLTTAQIDGLLRAARANWREVEPAIFGTLLERALDPGERHALGAHYTPRAYVERLVMPTVIEPLRAEWQHALGAALVLAGEADALDGRKREDKLAEARAELRRFHHRLCHVRVLDPACGSGNFLYVTLEHLKRLEGEVLDRLEALGESTQGQLGMEGGTVTLRQMLGIELNPRAAALAELVLWIGWLQWQIRTGGEKSVAEPVVHDYGNIACRDAVLAYDGREPATDAEGRPVTRWDGRTKKIHPVTGKEVPDESVQVPEWSYIRPRKAEWPQADFIVGNPPFIGNKRMRELLGNGYAEALRQAWPDVQDSAEFVMYWWNLAAEMTRTGESTRFGLITTNSLTMIFNRRVIEHHFSAKPSLHLDFAIPDHPWVDASDGAAVRIAMTVGSVGSGEGRLQTCIAENEAANGEVEVELVQHSGQIHADLKIGANVAATRQLQSNRNLSVNGMMRAGNGFLVSPETAQRLTADINPALSGRLLRQFRNGKDLTNSPRGFFVVDAFGLTQEQLRTKAPAVYQHLLDHVKPERDQNNRPRLREQWWIFAEPRKTLRTALEGLPRYIATVETAKHRIFQFLDISILPEHKLLTWQ